jgi:hypothetical protein
VAGAQKNALKPWLQQPWCLPEGSGAFVAAMEDVLALSAEPYDLTRPKVCFDETSRPLLAEKRAPRPVQPGQPARVDYE